MTFRVLFVCAANVCRSPTAAEIFTGSLPQSLSPTIVTESAGINAEPGAPWCPVAQRWVARHGLPTGKPTEHRSRHLTPTKMSRAGLILVADSEVKSAVLRADLRTRRRLFTLLEAAALAGGVESALADARSGHAGGSLLQLEQVPRPLGDRRLEWLVGEMDAARGLVVPVGRKRRASVIDIRDPHVGRRSPSHGAALRAVSGAVVTLTGAMRAVNAE